MSSHRKRSRAAGVSRTPHYTPPGSRAPLPEAVPVVLWGNPYDRISFAAQGSSEQRESHNLPISSADDSHSRGPDGWTGLPLNHGEGRDDILRGPDGRHDL